MLDHDDAIHHKLKDAGCDLPTGIRFEVSKYGTEMLSKCMTYRYRDCGNRLDGLGAWLRENDTVEVDWERRGPFRKEDADDEPCIVHAGTGAKVSPLIMLRND